MTKDTTITSVYKHRRLKFEDFVAGDKMQRVLATATNVAPHPVSIMIVGENGTGKNLVAMAVHNASPRAGKPFIAFNCSAVPASLLESELFGHEKGSFTSADRTRKGKFELANEGTLFLDEIGDMSLSAQIKILRVVEYGEYERVGGEDTLTTGARIICATNRDLNKLIKSGEFRSDLFFRLKEVLIEIPPLRERREDIPILCDRFLKDYNHKFGKQIAGFSPDTLPVLMDYDWPGNVRELRNVVKFAVVISPDLSIVDHKIIEDQLLRGIWKDTDDEQKDFSITSVEKTHIIKVLKLTSGNKKRACELLGIARPTLDRKLKEFEIVLDDIA